MSTSEDNSGVVSATEPHSSNDEQSSNAPTLVVSTPDDDTEVQPSTQSSDDMTPDAHAPVNDSEVQASPPPSDAPTLPVSSSDK